MKIKSHILLLLSATLANAYSCPSSCQRPSCVCASQSPPLPLSDTPMFVTLTWDDSVQQSLVSAIQEATGGFSNPNGCGLPSTYFVSTEYTDFHLTQTLAAYGNEIAAHTVNHFDMTKIKNPGVEMASSANILSRLAGIPENRIYGFRHPFLSFNKFTYDQLFSYRNFFYESSVTLNPNSGWWPHTLDYGMPYYPQPCTGCPKGEDFVYKGKWIVPMYYLVDRAGGLYTSMDPVIKASDKDDYAKTLDILKYNFDLHYARKIPFGLYQHAVQMIINGADDQKYKIQLLKDIIAYTKSKSDVWYVTNQQLIRWMQDPVPTSQMSGKFPCPSIPSGNANQEICDGIDNNKNGLVDENLVKSCSYNSQRNNFKTCIECPGNYPNASNEWALIGGLGTPDCASGQFWDPTSKSCVKLDTVTPTGKPLLGNNDGNNLNSNSNNTSQSAGYSMFKSLGEVLVLFYVARFILRWFLH